MKIFFKTSEDPLLWRLLSIQPATVFIFRISNKQQNRKKIIKTIQ